MKLSTPLLLEPMTVPFAMTAVGAAVVRPTKAAQRATCQVEIILRLSLRLPRMHLVYSGQRDGLPSMVQSYIHILERDFGAELRALAVPQRAKLYPTRDIKEPKDYGIHQELRLEGSAGFWYRDVMEWTGSS